MQCKTCGSRDFQKSAYNYYICSTCGNLYYEDKFSKKKPKPISDIYFILIIGTAVMIVTILILLFVTASSKKQSMQQMKKTPAAVEVKK